jgi:hypothetical protein
MINPTLFSFTMLENLKIDNALLGLVNFQSVDFMDARCARQNHQIAAIEFHFGSPLCQSGSNFYTKYLMA